MKIQVEDKKPCQKILKIELPKERLKEVHEKVVLEFQARSHISGFRQGKAPLPIVVKRYYPEIKSEVLKQLLPKVCQEALETEKISPVCDPMIDEVTYDLEKGLAFHAVVDVRPNVDLPDYKKLKLEKESVLVEANEVDQMIQELKDRHAVFNPVTGRDLNYGDFAQIDYSAKDNKGKKQDYKNVLIQIKEKGTDEFTDQLVGMKPGETRNITLGSPQSGEKISLPVKLAEIKEKKLPEIDDDFLKVLGGIKNADELRQKIKEDITLYKEKNAKNALRNSAVRHLTDQAKFDIPKSQEEEEIQNIYSGLENQVRQGKLAPKTLKDPQVLKDLEQEAVNRIKAAYILNEIGKKEAISVTDDELNAEIKRAAQHLGSNPEIVKADFEKNNKMDYLKVRLAQDKVIDFIIEHAIIKDKK